MTREQFEKWRRAQAWEGACEELLKKKGRDYAGEADHFANFRRRAAELKVSPELVWAVLAGKQWDAVMTFVDSGHLESEPILSRLMDLRNYVDLLAAQVWETEKEREQKKDQCPALPPYVVGLHLTGGEGGV